MKLFFYIFVAFLFSITLVNGQTTKKVLFIGNSYTSVNNLPLLVKNMAMSTGDALIYDSNMPGGARFLNHAVNATTLTKINSNAWDYVVLQAQSQETSLSQTQMETEVYPYATTLCNAIRENNECSQPLFYMTWGRENGDASNCNFIPWVCTYEGMDDAIRSSYEFMAQENHTELAPVGVVWRYLRTNYPSIDLYSSDSSHPSLEGSYAAACTFYAMIYKKDPTLITWNSTLSETVTTTIKLAAKTIVYDEIAIWDYTINPAVAGYSEVIQGGEVSFSNTSEAFDSLLWDFGDGTTSTEINPIHTYAMSGFYTVTLTVIKCGKSDSQTKTIGIDTTLNTDNFTLENAFTIYPNPTSNLLNITLNQNFKNIKVILFDTKGNAVINKEVQDLSVLSLDISTLSSGTYVLKIKADQETFTSKIIKK